MNRNKIDMMTLDEKKWLCRTVLIYIVNVKEKPKAKKKTFSFLRELIESLVQTDDYMIQHKWRKLICQVLEAEHTGCYKQLNNVFPLGWQKMPCLPVELVEDHRTTSYDMYAHKYDISHLNMKGD